MSRFGDKGKKIYEEANVAAVGPAPDPPDWSLPVEERKNPASGAGKRIEDAGFDGIVIIRTSRVLETVDGDTHPVMEDGVPITGQDRVYVVIPDDMTSANEARLKKVVRGEE
tara:strand:- start:200 stop:535 length:336 start_codon:yes stop_codon:yes gene_type:complete